MSKKKKSEVWQDAVANGGFLTHIKPKGGHASLCGHAPDSPRGFHFHRACWKDIRLLDLTAKRFRWCKRCLARYQERTGTDVSDVTDADKYG